MPPQLIALAIWIGAPFAVCFVLWLLKMAAG